MNNKESRIGPRDLDASERNNFSRPRYLNSVQLLSHVRIFATPWTGAFQASLSITNSRSLLKLMSIKSVTSSDHLILCYLLLLLPSIFPSIRVFSDESVLPIRWPNYWSFSVEELEGFKQIHLKNVFAPLMTQVGSWDEHNKGL